MKNNVKINEEKINKFDCDFYMRNKNYKVASALKALIATNDVQKAYFKEGPLTQEEYILRLYALLQALFVSIDSLYSLTLSLVKSKDYININNNTKIRTLRYIRNNVVGHPSNRILDNKDESYCILDTSSVSLESFSYSIYSYDEVTLKKVDINELLDAYYDESNKLLDNLYRMSKNDMNKTKLETMIADAIKKYELKLDYINELEEFVNEYRSTYKNSSAETNRVLWRYETIILIRDIRSNNEQTNDFYNFIIGVLLSKIYSLVTGKIYSLSRKKLPDYLGGFFKFLNKNLDLVPYSMNLLDSENPYFASSIKKLISVARTKSFKDAICYLELIYKHYSNNEFNILNAIALPIKYYKKK